jgi:hypothetical protein
MPRGPQGQKRPIDPARNALKILKIATGEIEEELQKSSEEHPYARAGGRARAKTLTKAQRSTIARKAAYARWHKVETAPE